MFIGIVAAIGEITAVVPRADDLRRLTIACDFDSIALSASIVMVSPA